MKHTRARGSGTDGRGVEGREALDQEEMPDLRRLVSGWCRWQEARSSGMVELQHLLSVKA